MDLDYKISIITPVLNCERYIRQAIESVLSQNYPYFEHIVVDGISTDHTVNIVKEYDHLVWVSEKDAGPADAANKGFKMATGDLICHLPADDFFEPEAFKAVAGAFKRYPDCKWVSGYARIIDTDGNEIRKFVTWYKNFLLKHHSFRLLLTECYINGQTVFFKKELFNEFGYFDLQLPTEYDLWLKFAFKYDMRLIRKNLASFRMHKGATTSSFFRSQEKIALQAAKKHGRNYPFTMLLRTFNHYKIIFIYSLLNRFL